MGEVDEIFDYIVQYEEENNLQDISSPDELEDIDLSPEDIEFLQSEGNKLPPIPEGKEMSPAMLNFARTVTKAYRLCYFQFLHFIENSDVLNPDILGYCTRINIDSFFQEVIAKRTTTAAVNRRFVSAIQKYSNFWEERVGFNVESDAVKKALEDAKVCARRFHSQSIIHVDAHKYRPTRHPSPAQELTMIEEALNDHTHSKYGFLPIGINFLISWNCAMQGFTRGDEVRNCRLPDLCHEINYGPWRLSEQGLTNVRDQSTPEGILSLIQQPLNTKIRSNKAHVIGFFRHKDWRRCATSLIAFSIMARFHYMVPSQLESFFKIGENQVPNWYNYYLIDWREYDAMATAFKEYFAKAGIDYTKLTHTRKLGIIRAHQMGADRENIILLSKHTTHKVDTSYLPELPYTAMLASAGFDVFRRQEYYIPRSYAKVPEGWITQIFPYLNLWRQHVNETWGYDKGMSAKNFVNTLLPFLAEIVVQDGIYFTTMYPQHPYSKMLLQKLQPLGYEQWSTDMRASIENREVTIQENENEDRRYEAMLRTTEHTVRKVSNLEQRIDSLRSEFIALKRFLVQRHCSTPNNLIASSQPSLGQRHEVTPVHLDAVEFSSTINERSVSNESRTLVSVQPTPVTSTQVRSVPNIPPNLHKSITENMEYFLTHRYWEFLSRNGTSLRDLGWPKRTQHRFCKRRDVALWVRKVGEKVLSTELNWEADHETLMNTASALDEERGSKTVSMALNEFKKESDLSWIKSRKKKNSQET